MSRIIAAATSWEFRHLVQTSFHGFCPQQQEATYDHYTGGLFEFMVAGCSPRPVPSIWGEVVAQEGSYDDDHHGS
jgi:hypothetical protein